MLVVRKWLRALDIKEGENGMKGKQKMQTLKRKGVILMTKGLKAWKKISKVSFTWVNLNGGIIIALIIKREKNMEVFCHCFEICYSKVILNECSYV